VVGAGQWGLNYVRALGELEGCSMSLVCDVSQQRLEHAESRQPGVRTTTSLDDVLNDPDIDAAIVATPATRHFEVASRLLAAGKHCLVEKPMTTTVEDAVRLGELAQEHSRLLMVGHVFRHNEGVEYVRGMVGRGDIGEVLYIYFTRTNLGPIRSDVNVVWDLMSHDVSIAFHLLNRMPEWASAQGACYLDPSVQDVAFATLGFPGGVVANMRVSWLDPRKVREITVVGANHMVVIDDMSPDPVRIYDKGAIREPVYETFGEFKMVTRSGAVTIPAIRGGEPLKRQCQHFLEAIGRGRVALGDASDGIRVVQTLVAINESIRHNGAPVSVSTLELEPDGV